MSDILSHYENVLESYVIISTNVNEVFQHALGVFDTVEMATQRVNLLQFLECTVHPIEFLYKTLPKENDLIYIAFMMVDDYTIPIFATNDLTAFDAEQFLVSRYNPAENYVISYEQAMAKMVTIAFGLKGEES